MTNCHVWKGATYLCSETFLRLSEEKRKRVLDAAWGEFTRVSYAEVSINQIIQRAGISRGSFYQYFKDKEALMRYLMQEGWAYLMRGYHANLKAVGGDLFALQLLCFDQFLDQWEHTDPVLERFLLFLRLNPGLDVQGIRNEDAKCAVLEALVPDIDMGRFHCQEMEFLHQAFALCLGSLAGAVVESVMHPERSAALRRELALRLEIIRRGCGS